MSCKVCFDFICDEALIFSNVGKKMQEQGIAVCGISLGGRWKHAREGFDVYSLDLMDDQEIDWQSELKRISKQYIKYNPAGFTQADRFVSQLDRELQRKILVFTFLKIEEIVSAGVTIFITTGVAYLYNLVILAVSDHFCIRAISLYGARQPEPRFTFSLSKGGVWDKVNKQHLEIRKNKSIELKEEVAYVESFREKAKNPDYMSSARQLGGVRWVFIQEFINRLKNWYFNGWDNPADYITQHPVWYAWRDVKRILNKKYINLMFKFDKPSAEDEYYIYPLHLQPEASTLILGDDYVDQLNTIKAISKRLPADKVLYVKEHPAAYGRHSVTFYKGIQKIHNVKLIHYREDARKLILGSNGVVVISGTMGWEALLLGVPAIVLGSVFYESFDGVRKIETLKQLTSYFQDIPVSVPSIKDGAVALKAIQLGSYQGYFDVHKLDTTKKALSSENLDLLYNGLHEILE